MANILKKPAYILAKVVAKFQPKEPSAQTTLAQAVATLANFFYEPQVSKDGTVVNAFDFSRKDVVGNICYSADNSVSFTQKRVDAVAAVIKGITEAWTGDEIQMAELAKQDWLIERMQGELEAKITYRNEIFRAHEQILGVQYLPRTKANTGASVDRRAVAAKYNLKVADVGKTAPHVPNVNGVDSAVG
tara:strand:+ start:975 stop:1541 length:567 start_codon:yes stop_codon:yes gene_type:complete